MDKHIKIENEELLHRLLAFKHIKVTKADIKSIVDKLTIHGKVFVSLAIDGTLKLASKRYRHDHLVKHIVVVNTSVIKLIDYTTYIHGTRYRDFNTPIDQIGGILEYKRSLYADPSVTL